MENKHNLKTPEETTENAPNPRKRMRRSIPGVLNKLKTVKFQPDSKKSEPVRTYRYCI